MKSTKRTLETRKGKAGLRLIELWVPDTRSRRFAAQCRRQSLIVKNDPAEMETLDFMTRAAPV